ncbi:DUF262 domain-containing protein [Gordonia sp. N1V]|uniref:DUF262 domain-containing protein n=1 Tax=Gordonia sp. N1V TaxID=3034163 RepID=UPI0023E0AF60|nr:DUF262 domain-containing protein [Gordonia sp. N1V]MDF3285477.1 DUF262 domain-containing protein [Gordonia sp. N1V]
MNHDEVTEDDEQIEAPDGEDNGLDDAARLPAEGDRASWLDDASQEIDDNSVLEYDIVSSPNDWNFATIVNFIESGAIKIPAFQRNYIWDKKRASKLIESLLIGLPVPQVFLYEEGKNNFIVIDGQQRLLTLFFFAKGRFPLPKIRSELRPSLNAGIISDDVLHDRDYFTDFKLTLAKSVTGKKNRYHGFSYMSLKDDKTTLNLRTIRNVVVKQTSPDGDSAMYEIFSRLNTGGVNLTPQEIRASLYHSQVIDSLLDLNLKPQWRNLVGQSSPDSRMRDTEFLLRSLALARGLDEFSGSMTGFVNKFCESVKSFSDSQAEGAISDLRTFIESFAGGGAEIFSRGGKFSGVLFESIFAAWVRCGRPEIDANDLVEAVSDVKTSAGFAGTLQEGSTKSVNITARVRLAEDALNAMS